MINLQDVVKDLIKTDDGFTDKNDQNILRLYNNSTGNERELVDRIFINLCGVSLSTIITDIYPTTKE
jgi:hypothetical protein